MNVKQARKRRSLIKRELSFTTSGTKNLGQQLERKKKVFPSRNMGGCFPWKSVFARFVDYRVVTTTLFVISSVGKLFFILRCSSL